MKLLFQFLIFPGFLFITILGGILFWVDRKITARIQYRVGPPWYQNFVDVLKLFGKEVIIPRNAHKAMFVLAPFLGFSSLLVSGFMLWKANIIGACGFQGDLIVIVYLLTLPALSLILGGFASANPLASLGASREIKLLLGYELVFILTILIPIIKTGEIRIYDIVRYQAENGSVIHSISGAIAFAAMVFVMQAKLGLVPFDVAEAETEIIAGPLVEYSGALLGIFRLNKIMSFAILPLFMLTCFWRGFSLNSIFIDTLRLALIVIIFTLIRNTNPRLRVDQALRFFWMRLSFVSLVAVIFALGGM